jgi:hypothetical protein
MKSLSPVLFASGQALPKVNFTPSILQLSFGRRWFSTVKPWSKWKEPTLTNLSGLTTRSTKAQWRNLLGG